MLTAIYWMEHWAPSGGDDHVAFVFEFVYTVDYIDGFPYIKPSLYPWDEAYLITLHHHFDVFLEFIQIFKIILLDIFCFHLHFKCYPESPLCHPYSPTPTSWPWHSPVLGHIKFVRLRGLSSQ